MKYEEKVTYRTTASGGQETITEMVPVYNRFEERAMRRREMKDASKKSGGKNVPHGLMFIGKHPTLFLLVIGLIAIFIVYMVSSANYMLDDLVKQYTSLTARKDDSKYSFDKRLFYITVNADGTKTVTFGYKSEVAQEAAEEAVEQAGESGGSGGTYNFTADDKTLIQAFKDLGASDRKAKGLLACYKAATDCGMTQQQTIGLLACAMCEGSPGLVQYSYPSVNNMPASLHKSSSNNPLYIDTQTKLNDLMSIQNNSDDMGIGTAQWTNGRCRAYLQLAKTLYGTQTVLSEDDLFVLDYTMYKNELSGSYHSLVTDIDGHDSSVEAILVFSWAKYEAGFGNYKGDNISSYSGWKIDQLNNRYPNAVAIDAKFRSLAGGN